MEAIQKTMTEFAGLIREIESGITDTKAIIRLYRPSIMNERYYTKDEIKELLHLSDRTLVNYRKKGTLSYVRIGGNILYRESDIARLLEDNTVPAIKY